MKRNHLTTGTVLVTVGYLIAAMHLIASTVPVYAGGWPSTLRTTGFGVWVLLAIAVWRMSRSEIITQASALWGTGFMVFVLAGLAFLKAITGDALPYVHGSSTWGIASAVWLVGTGVALINDLMKGKYPRFESILHEAADMLVPPIGAACGLAVWILPIESTWVPSASILLGVIAQSWVLASAFRSGSPMPVQMMMVITVVATEVALFYIGYHQRSWLLPALVQAPASMAMMVVIGREQAELVLRPA